MRQRRAVYCKPLVFIWLRLEVGCEPDLAIITTLLLLVQYTILWKVFTTYTNKKGSTVYSESCLTIKSPDNACKSDKDIFFTFHHRWNILLQLLAKRCPVVDGWFFLFFSITFFSSNLVWSIPTI